ncbi:glycosyltransferase family 39 protein [Ruicaihuangia caeni]|uniref:Glycosyltransferase family 39 protein n=1 Tax=Ruicaihuangia caeni TaxID=3042517 RepID=A0AAW6TAA6_9MICO|nr:glycosyltransferase family 39 protein [Klugiella sp. YN-L-19]MDI2099268.1 glycosyltransferase family 39 protein [Klugiella sp. YN-L-19]
MAITAVSIGALGFGLAASGSGIPSYWGDEAASILATQRPFPALLALLLRIDAVHGLYYSFLQVWTGVFGTGEFATRFPSTVAVGFAAAGVVVLANRLLGPRLGLVSGAVFAVLPVVTRYGAETRSYGMVIAASVWLMVLLVHLAQRRSRSIAGWASFAFASAVSVHLFVYLVLLWPVQFAMLLLLRAPRSVMVRWLSASSVALVLSLPFIMLAVSQRFQIAFLAEREYATAASALAGQWFDFAVWFAILAWALMVAAAAAASRWSELRPACAIAAIWALLPTVVLLIGNALVTPMYNLRYTAFSAPAVAMLMAIGIEGVRRALAKRLHPRRAEYVTAALVAAIVIAVAPVYMTQRTPFSKAGGADFRQTAAAVAAHAQPGDAIVFDETTRFAQRPRLAIDLYPEQFAGVHDVALEVPYFARDWLWDEVATLPETLKRLAGYDRVWVLERGRNQAEVDAVRSLGFNVRQSIPVNRIIVYELVRK